METPELLLFQNALLSNNRNESIDSCASDSSKEALDKPVIGDIDHHMIDIVAAYIRRLPDKKTRKKIARIMLNTIIKSAEL